MKCSAAPVISENRRVPDDALTSQCGEGMGKEEEWEKRRQARWRGNIAGQQAIPHDSAHCLTHFSCCAQSTAQTSPTLAALFGDQTEAHEKLNALTEVHHGARSKGHFHVPHQPALPTQPFDGSFALRFY